MRLGMELHQCLEGTYHRLATPGDERPFSLELDIRLSARGLVTDRAGRLSGEVHAPGLVERASLEGRFSAKLDGRVSYDFRFEADDAKTRRFHGESEWDLLRPKRSLERVFGRVFEDDEEMARVLLHTPLEQSLIQLLRSARPSLK
ncbi:MAG: hypothetical protein AB8H86_07390 [Polyangiales bacterium]